MGILEREGGGGGGGGGGGVDLEKGGYDPPNQPWTWKLQKGTQC